LIFALTLPTIIPVSRKLIVGFNLDREVQVTWAW
jgi:hypothetical protein